jgi:hypothetical protein
MAKKKVDARTASLQRNWVEIEKMLAGLNDGMLEAFEMLGVTLAQEMKRVEQADLYMAVIFELLPFDVQQKMLNDPRVEESATILPRLKQLRA